MLCVKKNIHPNIKFDLIEHSLQKMDDVKFISSFIEPYILLIEYKNEPIQFIYDFYSGKLIIGFNFNYVKLNNLTYELLEQKGIRYYLNLLIDLKVKELRNYVTEIKELMKNENIIVDIYNEEMSIAFSHPQTELYVTNYNNHVYDSDIRFMIDEHSLRWKINFYSHSKEWSFINMIDIREKGVSYFLDLLRGSKKY